MLDDPDMSVPLKKDISLYLYRNILGNVSFLKNASPDVVTRLCSFLTLEVYMPREFIFQKGDRGRDLYIIKRGTVAVLRNSHDEEENQIAELTTNQFFGETALLSGIGRGHGGHRSCSVRASTITELLQLSIDSFNKIVLEFPTFKEEMLNLSLRRKASNGSKINGVQLGKGIERQPTWVPDGENGNDETKSGPSSGGYGGGGGGYGGYGDAMEEEDYGDGGMFESEESERECDVFEFSPACGSVELEASAKNSTSGGGESILIQDIHQTVYTVFVRNYLADKATEWSNAKVNFFPPFFCFFVSSSCSFGFLVF